MDWHRVADAVRQRRLLLGLPQGTGGVSPATWGKIENAKETSYKRRTLVAICRVLRWTPDSIDRLLRGEEPMLLDPVDEVERLNANLNRATQPMTNEELAEQLEALADFVHEIAERQDDLRRRVMELEHPGELEEDRLRRAMRDVNAALEARATAQATRGAPSEQAPERRAGD